MKKLLSFLITLCVLFACTDTMDSEKDESLSGTIKAKITTEKTPISTAFPRFYQKNRTRLLTVLNVCSRSLQKRNTHAISFGENMLKKRQTI